MIMSRSSVNETFDVGETVLCYHGPLLYAAKVRGARARGVTRGARRSKR